MREQLIYLGSLSSGLHQHVSGSSETGGEAVDLFWAPATAVGALGKKAYLDFSFIHSVSKQLVGYTQRLQRNPSGTHSLMGKDRPISQKLQCNKV